MKKLTILLLLLVLRVAAQNAVYQNIAIGRASTSSNLLVAIPNAQITVLACQNNGSGTVTCVNTLPASLCLSLTDPVCGQSNQITADANGNIVFYVTPGLYVVQVSAAGFITYTYSDVAINSAFGNVTGPVVAGAPLTPGLIPQISGPNTIVNSNPPLDNSGSQVAGALLYKGPNGIVLPADGVHPGAVQIVGNTTLPPNLQATNNVGFLGPNNASFTSWFCQLTATPPAVNQVLTITGTPTGVVAPCGWASALPTASAQIGDIVRFNVNGDGQWDPVNYAQEVNGAYSVTGGNPNPFGALCNAMTNAAGVGTADVFPTATIRGGRTLFISAIANTSTVTGMICGQNGSNSLFPLLAWNRWSFQFQINVTLGVRYWMGLGTWNSGSVTGTNSTAILNTTKYATDTPNSNTLGFRFSAGTDTDWQAVACKAGTGCTVQDTGVVASSAAPHLFEMTTNATGTAVCYYIDTVLVTNTCITTNLPTIGGTQDSLADMFWTGDNKNTAGTASATFYRWQISMR